MAQRKHPRAQRSSPNKITTPGLRPINRAGVSNGIACLVLVLFTLLAYANAWPDNITFDDRVFVDSSRFSGLSIADVLRFFSEDLWAASGTDSKLYRPLLLLFIAAESQLFGEWMAGYHLVNIVLHVLATLLVYGFLRQLLELCGHERSESRALALLVALLFGVHPIHAEVVNSVFNGSEILVTIGVVGGLKWFLDCRQKQPGKAWLGLNMVYVLVLFCRESSAALPLLAVAVLWLTRSDSWQQRLRACAPVLSLLLPLGIYLVLRSHALATAVVQGSGAEPGLQPPGAAGQVFSSLQHGLGFNPARVQPAIGMWFEGLKIQLWPHPLQIYYDAPGINTRLALAAQLAVLVGAVVAYVRKRPLFLIGLAFFYIAILPSSGLMGESGSYPGLADRILYLPSVGFAIMLAFGLWLFARKFSLNAAVIATLIICAVLMPLTWSRNADWASDILLFETDYQKLRNKSPILNTLLAAQLREKNNARAVELCDAHLQRDGSLNDLGTHCGSAYGQVGRYKDAERAFLSVGRRPLATSFAHFNLAMMYLHLGRRIEAEEQVGLAIKGEAKTFLRKYFEAVALIQMHPTERSSLLAARTLLMEALELQPQHAESREELEALNRKLSEAPAAH